MTRAYPDIEERAALRIPCPFCDAAPTHWCRNHLDAVDRPRPKLHKRRLHAGRMLLLELTLQGEP